MKLHTLRLHPGNDLRQSLQAFAAHHRIQAGFIITCVGALTCLHIRMAGATPDKQVVKKLAEEFEIVSLVGTLTADDCHLHISASDKEGAVWGGHLKEGTIVDVTAEVVIGEDEESLYTRVMDDETGFEELEVTPK